MSVRTMTPVSLESGDHLTRAEFHRRYLARPDIRKAELVDGVVYVASPIRLEFHARPHGFVVTWLGFYVSLNPEIILSDNGTVFLDEGGEIQPDACLLKPGDGAAQMQDDGYIHGAPRLVIEVAASSASYDLHEKKEAYRRNGVQEYVIWRVLDEAIDWLRLVDGTYVVVEPDAAGIVESAQFPGLRLDVPNMLAGNLAAVLQQLRPTA